MTRILGIETSCDETAAAVVEDGRTILSNVVSSQSDLHSKYGGVVPELASRAHLERIVPVVREAIAEANLSYEDVDAVAVTRGPGLIGALLVGVNYARALAASIDRPVIGVNHLEGHLHACLLAESQAGGGQAEPEFPAVALVVSGGHTSLYLMEKKSGSASDAKANGGFPYRYTLLGRTLDDAAGEAFDKVAKLLGLGYPGGPLIDRLSKNGNDAAHTFTRPKIKSGRRFDFSFSGIKTAVARLVKEKGIMNELQSAGEGEANDSASAVRDVAASFQRAVVIELTEKLITAAEEYGAQSVFLTGGVAANSLLRDVTGTRCRERGFAFAVPPLLLSTDNAAMIAAAAYPHLQAGETAGMELDAAATFPLGGAHDLRSGQNGGLNDAA